MNKKERSTTHREMLNSQKAQATITNRAKRLEKATITFMETSKVKMTSTNFTPHLVANRNKVKTVKVQISTSIAIFIEQNRAKRTNSNSSNKRRVKATSISRQITTREIHIRVGTLSSSMNKKRLVVGVRQSKSTTKECLVGTIRRVLNLSLIGTISRQIGIK